MKRIMNFKNTVLLAATIAFLSGCSKSFDQEIAQYIELNCKDLEIEECTIDINDITEFEWDRMYVFGGLTIPSEIDGALGFMCNCDPVEDNYMRIVFVNGDQVVNQSEYHGLDGKVQFRRASPDDKYLSYSSQSSKFLVVKKSKSIVKEDFYDLYPVK